MEHIEIAYEIYMENCESEGLEPLDYIDFIIEQGS